MNPHQTLQHYNLTGDYAHYVVLNNYRSISVILSSALQAMTDQQRLGEISPYLRLRVSPRARRLALRLNSHDRLIDLVVPKRTRFSKAYEFAKSHEEWIDNKLKSLPIPIPFEDGTVIPVNGTPRKIVINHNSTLRMTDILLKEKEIIVSTNKENPSSRIERFLKNLSRDITHDLSVQKAHLINRKIKKISVRDTKTRWGSCSTDGSLSFSWRLIFAPPEAIDYIVSHEVAHLKHMNHSTAFWNTCRELCTDYLEGSLWIKNYGNDLMRYGQQDSPVLPEG